MFLRGFCHFWREFENSLKNIHQIMTQFLAFAHVLATFFFNGLDSFLQTFCKSMA